MTAEDIGIIWFAAPIVTGLTSGLIVAWFAAVRP